MTLHDLTSIQAYLHAIGCHPIDIQKGFFTCPGKHWHTTANAESDCKLFDNGRGFFQLYCVHTSCADNIALANKTFAAIAKQRGIIPHDSSASEPATNADLESEIDTEGMKLLQEIQGQFAWDYANIIADSDDAINEPVEQHYLQLLSLFDDDDFVWVGRDVFDSGSPKHACRFRPAKEWLSEQSAPGAFICPSTFKPKTHSRKAENILMRKFLVVESDNLGRDDIGGIFRWMNKALGLQLRAVVDTAGKSLHGWFDYPAPRVAASLKKWLPRLQCDPALFNPVQPCRLPGATRMTHDGEKHQRLIFIR